MKKKLILLCSLISLAVCSCHIEDVGPFHTYSEHKTSTRGSNSEYPYEIYEVTYKGHEYIVFAGNADHNYRSGAHSGVVHNPDCQKCKDK